MNEKLAEAFLTELVNLRKSIDSLAVTITECQSEVHMDLSDVVSSIDSFTLAAAVDEADNLDD